MKTVSIEYLRRFFSYDPETGTVTRLTDNKVMNQVGSNGYIVVNWFKQIWKIHRIAWALHYNEWPTNDLDHINETRKTIEFPISEKRQEVKM